MELMESALGLPWTTNVGQDHHSCPGSRFQMDYTGDHNGLTVDKGAVLTKGSCPNLPSTAKPIFTHELHCATAATGCHMWCAPVWASHHDTTDWSAFDSRCKDWDGTFNASDSACSTTSKLFTWARP